MATETTYEIAALDPNKDNGLHRLAIRDNYDEALTVQYDCILQKGPNGPKYPNGIILHKVKIPTKRKG